MRKIKKTTDIGVVVATTIAVLMVTITIIVFALAYNIHEAIAETLILSPLPPHTCKLHPEVCDAGPVIMPDTTDRRTPTKCMDGSVFYEVYNSNGDHYWKQVLDTHNRIVTCRIAEKK
jgi:hypothetical protein